uniref:Uncharacterized protein n=1 Tax=Helianthus annuus TaxID=4232 RepID=A0A251S0U2_HELAN
MSGTHTCSHKYARPPQVERHRSTKPYPLPLSCVTSGNSYPRELISLVPPPPSHPVLRVWLTNLEWVV